MTQDLTLRVGEYGICEMAGFSRGDLRTATSPQSEHLKIGNVSRAKHIWSVRESLETVEHRQPG